MTIAAWIRERRATLRPEVAPLPWALNREWRFQDGVLRHRADGFFSVFGAGISAPGTGFHGLEMPMIHQPEVGLLGFVVAARKDDCWWLLQAKSEPGSVDFVQVAPTVQATQSNYRQVHGGSVPPFLDFFQEGDEPLLADTLQSEQGFRFDGKFNRNALRLVASRFECRHASWRWFRAGDVRRALGEDFLINTDARSAIVCAPWRLICGRRGAFSSAPVRIASDFVSALSASYRTGCCGAAHLIGRLREAESDNTMSMRRVPLERLKHWTIGEANIHCTDQGADIEVGSYSVVAPGREVEHWHQPLFRGLNEHRAGLIFQQRDGRLKTFLRFSAEPGFGRRVEYGPSYQTDGINPRWVEELVLEMEHLPLLSIRQSDEGGRFMHAITCYALHDLKDDNPLPASEGGEWVDIAELEALCRTARVLTNEGRSAVSLLLSLA